MIKFIVFLLVYFVGIVITQIILSKFKKFFGIDYSSNPNPDYDDYADDASAIAMFSIFWPIYYCMKIIHGTITFFYNSAKFIESKCNTNPLN